MNHVLKLVGQDRFVIGVVPGAIEPIQVDVEHLLFIGEVIGQAAVLVGAAVIAGHARANAGGMQHVEPRVIVHAGVPFAAKERTSAG